MTRDEAIEILRYLPINIGRQNGKHLIQEAMNMAIEALKERKHGKWIDGLDVPKEERERQPYVYLHGEKYCSVCYKEAYFDADYGQQLFNYCPNCGAEMKND